MWQELARLFRLRNWLTHNKESLIGYIGNGGQPIVSDAVRLPKIDPETELLKPSIERFYNAVRKAGMLLGTALGDEAAYAFLETEMYEPVVVG